MRRFVISAAIAFVASSVTAQNLCCPCETTNKKKFQSPAVAASDCAINCAANGGPEGAHSVPPHRVIECDVQPVTSLTEDVKWSINHQGAGVWVGHDNDTLLTGEALRSVLLSVQVDCVKWMKMPGYYTIAAVDTATLDAVTAAAVKQCVAERDLTRDIEWVWSYRGLRYAMWGALQRRDYNDIRHMFSVSQAHDDGLRNRIYCMNGPQIRQVLERFGDPGEPPKWVPEKRWPEKPTPLDEKMTILIKRVEVLEAQLKALQTALSTNNAK